MWSGPRTGWGLVDYAVSKKTDLITIIVAFALARTTAHTFFLKQSLRDNPWVNAQKPLHVAQDRISQTD